MPRIDNQASKLVAGLAINMVKYLAHLEKMNSKASAAATGAVAGDVYRSDQVGRVVRRSTRKRSPLKQWPTVTPVA